MFLSCYYKKTISFFFLFFLFFFDFLHFLTNPDQTTHDGIWFAHLKSFAFIFCVKRFFYFRFYSYFSIELLATLINPSEMSRRYDLHTLLIDLR